MVEKRRKKKKKKQNAFLHFLPHICFFVAVIIIVIVGVVKLNKWNKGVESDYDPNAVTTDFDTETEDYFVPLTSATKDLQKDDGVNTILLMGNDMLTERAGKDDSIAAYLQSYTGGKVYDISIDHSYVPVKNFPFEDDYPADAYSFYWLASSLALGKTNFQSGYASQFDGYDEIDKVVSTITQLDMSAVDTIVIFYDHHDYAKQHTLRNIHVDTLPTHCYGAMKEGIKILQEHYPQIQFILVSPYYCFFEDDNGVSLPAGETDLGEGTLADYMISYKNVATDLGISFIDNYFGTITADNYAEFLDDEYKYPNDEGRQLLAQRIAKFINP